MRETNFTGGQIWRNSRRQSEEAYTEARAQGVPRDPIIRPDFMGLTRRLTGIVTLVVTFRIRVEENNGRVPF